MSRQPSGINEVSWADLERYVTEHEDYLGVTLEVHLAWRQNLTTGAWVEVLIREGREVGRGEELMRVREAFPTRKGSGHAAAVLRAVAAALRAQEHEPWCWSKAMRSRAAKQP